MKCNTTVALRLIAAPGIIWLESVFPSSSSAHCDAMDGPVVTEAKAALEKGDVTPVLKWVTKDNEEEIKTVFKKALDVRRTGSEAKEVADRFFFETLIRAHRAGEGEPFTGLKPAGAIEPAAAAADKAIAASSVDELAKELGQATQNAVKDATVHIPHVASPQNRP